jgi:putative transposase
MKPNAYTKLYVHCVFSPSGRQTLLIDDIEVTVHKYMYGILKEKNCYPIAINGTSDHIHILTGFPPSMCIENLVRDIKRSSSLFINSNHLVASKFKWQEGYGAFTVGYRDLDRVYHYVLNQKTHHSTGSFKNEYLGLLDENGIEFSDNYLFEFYNETEG